MDRDCYSLTKLIIHLWKDSFVSICVKLKTPSLNRVLQKVTNPELVAKDKSVKGMKGVELKSSEVLILNLF